MNFNDVLMSQTSNAKPGELTHQLYFEYYRNETLRFIWYQISNYQQDLTGPFDDFLKSVLDEIQQVYKKCQDLETTLSL